MIMMSVFIISPSLSITHLKDDNFLFERVPQIGSTRGFFWGFDKGIIMIHLLVQNHIKIEVVQKIMSLTP